MSGSIQTGLSGAAFGAALTLSNVWLPSIIVSQMNLEDFYMMIAFLSATAVSAAVMAVLERLRNTTCQPRKASSIGWFGAYDANIVGGILLGSGMTLTGACPGTILIQVATGVRSGILTAIGALVGGILYPTFESWLRKSSASQTLDSTKPSTIPMKLNLSANQVLLGFEILASLIIVMISTFGLNKSADLMNPVLGGILIGIAQAVSLLLTQRPVGVSGAYEEAGRFIRDWWIRKDGAVRNSTSSITFAFGVFLGGLLLSHTAVSIANVDILAFNALVGGAVMILGSRLAGGCTSGHGISGMSTFSISSIITVASMFGGGIGTAKLLA